MRQVMIKATRSGNCPCYECGKTQPGSKMQPLSVWYKDDNMKRGYNCPVCCRECAEKFAAEGVYKLK